MPYRSRSYRKIVMAAKRRRMIRRVTIIVCLSFLLAYFVPDMFNAWRHLGDRVMEESVRTYRPYDIEREALLAGQQVGQQEEGMTKPEYREMYKRSIVKSAPRKTSETFEVFDFAFSAGYRKTSEYNKRYKKK